MRLNWRAVSHRSSSPSIAMRCWSSPLPSAAAPSRSAPIARAILLPMPRTIEKSTIATGRSSRKMSPSMTTGTTWSGFSRKLE